MHARPDSTFTTPSQVSKQLQKADTGQSQAIADEFNDYFDLVKDYCFAFSKVIMEQVGKTFVPYRASKDIYTAEAIRNLYLKHNSDGYVLQLEEDLLALDNLTYLTQALASVDYRLLDDYGNANGYPYRRVQFNPDNVSSPTTAFNDKITVDGEWGTHDSPDNAYSTITTTIEELSSAATSINLTNGAGDLFEIYQYIRIEDELMLITAIDSSGDPDVLTVERGVNGFTAATHTSGSSIRRWNVARDVSLLATRMVAFWYGKRNDKGERVQVIDNTLVVAQFSKELAAIAKRRLRHTIGKI